MTLLGKRCKKCDTFKKMSQFNKNKSQKDGHGWECRSCMNVYKSSISGKSTRLYSSCKRRVKLSGGNLTITKEWIEERLVKGICEVTHLPFNFSGRGEFTRQPYAPSIDRKDPKNPNYTLENSRVVLWAVNNTMAEYGMNIMLPILKAIVENAKEKPPTPLPDEDYWNGEIHPQYGVIIGTGAGKDDNSTHDTGRAV
jgi:hypothetical protein